MDSAASGVGIASLGIQTCQKFLALLDSWSSGVSVPDSWKDSTSTFKTAYDTVADLHHVLALVANSLRSRHDLDEQKARCVSTCLSGCEDAFLEILKTLERLQDLREQDDTPKDSAGRRVAILKNKIRLTKTEAKLRPIVADIRERLEPALRASKPLQTDTISAITSGFDKGQTNRCRPSAQHNISYTSSPAAVPFKGLPAAEEGECANSQSDATSDSALAEQEHPRRNLHTSEVTKRQESGRHTILRPPKGQPCCDACHLVMCLQARFLFHLEQFSRGAILQYRAKRYG